jgi:hypothetical protein
MVVRVFVSLLITVIAASSNTVAYANPNLQATKLVDAEIRNDPSIYPPAEVRARLFFEKPATRNTSGCAPAPGPRSRPAASRSCAEARCCFLTPSQSLPVKGRGELPCFPPPLRGRGRVGGDADVAYNR